MFALFPQALAFLRKQPVFASIALWLLAVPYTLADITRELLERGGWQTGFFPSAGPQDSQRLNALPLIIAINLAVLLLHAWADSANLIVARRLLKKNVGRARTSFKAVARQARPFIVPIILTSILWVCQLGLGLVFLIIPGVIIGTRTFFFPMATVAEGKLYRASLRRSTEVVRGRTVRTLWNIMVIAAVVFLPVSIMTFFIDRAIEAAPFGVVVIGRFLANTLLAIGVVTCDILMTLLYVKLLNTRHRVKEA